MAIGERIRFIRNLRGMTQKYLGMAIGFTEKTADVRMAQYEAGARTPKENMVADIANVLEVCPQALTVPDIDNYIGLAHTLFTLEDLYGIKINNNDGQPCLTLDRENKSYLSMFDIFNAWSKEYEKVKSGEITEDEYNDWRYNYPRIEAGRTKEALDALRAEKEKHGGIGVEIVISIIGALSAIVVAAVGAFMANKNSNILQIRKLKEDHYVSYIEALHNIASDNNNRELISKYTYHRDKLLIIGSEKVICSILSYEEDAVGKSNSLHDEYLTSIVKAIREDLKIKDKSFPMIYLKK